LRVSRDNVALPGIGPADEDPGAEAVRADDAGGGIAEGKRSGRIGPDEIALDHAAIASRSNTNGVARDQVSICRGCSSAHAAGSRGVYPLVVAGGARARRIRPDEAAANGAAGEPSVDHDSGCKSVDRDASKQASVVRDELDPDDRAGQGSVDLDQDDGVG